jgi:hypothetical protein
MSVVTTVIVVRRELENSWTTLTAVVLTISSPKFREFQFEKVQAVFLDPTVSYWFEAAWWDCIWRMPSSGMLRCLDLLWTDVSEKHIASIFRVEKSACEEPAWAGGCILFRSSRRQSIYIYIYIYIYIQLIPPDIFCIILKLCLL